MSRPIRIEFPGALYHVIARGNEKRRIWLDEGDCRRFLRDLDVAAARYFFRFHAYVLMPNHYHLIVETPRAGLSRGIQLLNGRYAQYFNKRHNRVGHLFQGRFKDFLIEEESYLLTVSRYVHQNPVRAKLVEKAWDYPWSSCAAFAGMTPRESWLEMSPTFERLGGSEEGGGGRFRRFIDERMEDDPGRNAVGGCVLGEEEFVRGLEERFRESARSCEEFAERRFWLRPVAPHTVLERTRAVFGDDVSGSRSPLVRDISIFLLRERLALPLREIRSLFPLSNSGIRRCVQKIKARLRTDVALYSRIMSLAVGLSRVPSPAGAPKNAILGRPVPKGDRSAESAPVQT